MPREVPDWVWLRPLYKHNREENDGEECHHVAQCPYVFPDGKRCDKPGCWTMWKRSGETVGTSPPILTFVVMHCHYLVDSYAQRRNTSHIIEGTTRLALRNEYTITTRLNMKDIKFPDYVVEDFGRFDK